MLVPLTLEWGKPRSGHLRLPLQLSTLPFLRPPVFGSPLGLPRAANFKPFSNFKTGVHDMCSAGRFVNGIIHGSGIMNAEEEGLCRGSLGLYLICRTAENNN